MDFTFLQSPTIIQISGWIMAILTLLIFSFLYKDNPFYKFAEHLFVGVSAGYGVVIVYNNVIVPNLVTPVMNGRAYYLIFGVLGVMMLFKLSRKLHWISRWPLAYVVGAFAGIQIIAYGQSDLITQIRATIQPLWVAGDPVATLSNWLIVFGVLAGILYFFFSKKQTGALGVVTKIGIWFLMISFGASFGYTVMGRISLAIGRFQDLLEFPVISTIVLLIIIAVLVVHTIMTREPVAEE
ncbi:MAG: hypothetical protein ISR91_03905 [Candidatus Delongbacteria bacterium]|nr:hypothetical protein [Candidatus Delongbacteria bacterium]